MSTDLKKWFEFDTSRVYDFYGMDGESFKVDDDVVTVVCDDEDGYRSSLEGLYLDTAEGKIFFPNPVGKVMIREVEEEDDEFIGYEVFGILEDGGHVWIRAGTDHRDNYYPTFVFRYDVPKRLVKDTK